jgi:hypothetical protein
VSVDDDLVDESFDCLVFGHAVHRMWRPIAVPSLVGRFFGPASRGPLTLHNGLL